MTRVEHIEHRDFGPPAFAIDPVDRYLRDSGRYGAQPRPITPLRLYVSAKRRSDAAIQQRYEPPIPLITVVTASGRYASFNEVRTRDGLQWSGYFADGHYDLLILSELYQPLTLENVAVPAAAGAVPAALEPNEQYPIETAPRFGINPEGPSAGRSTFGMAAAPTILSGLVLDQTGRALADAMVQVSRAEPEDAKPPAGIRTGPSGAWRFVLPPFSGDVARLTVTASHPLARRAKTLRNVVVRAAETHKSEAIVLTIWRLT